MDVLRVLKESNTLAAGVPAGKCPILILNWPLRKLQITNRHQKIKPSFLKKITKKARQLPKIFESHGHSLFRFKRNFLQKIVNLFKLRNKSNG